MDAPLDETDAAILAELRVLMERVDPVPADLTERIEHSLTMAALNAELAELIAKPLAGVRAETSVTDSLTFTSSHLALMITVADRQTDTITVDGWVSVAGTRVEVHHIGGVDNAVSDDAGRLVLTCPRGPVWFLMDPPGETSLQPVVTPTVTL